MKKCKWAGDVNDEYCKSCDGINMMVDNISVSCAECAGYEAGEEDVEEETTNNNFMPIPEEELQEELPFKEEEKIVEGKAKNKPKSNESKKSNNNTKKKEKAENDVKNASTSSKTGVTKVSEEKKSNEVTKNVDGEIKVTSLRYTSGATIKKGDNYFKFIAEEEWDVSNYADTNDAREQLWAKLNGEVDRQIEELNNIN
nr:MAG TPA: hypothetical protein [Bacteriophage sp.]